MSFKYDVFISYAHADDEPHHATEKKWVTVLCDALSSRYRSRTGDPLRVWRDPLLRPGQVFDPVILERVRESAILLPIVSPSFIKSDYCLKEFQEFVQKAQHDPAGLVNQHKHRVLPLVKHPYGKVARPGSPAVAEMIRTFESIQEHRFYRTNVDSQITCELNCHNDGRLFDEQVDKLVDAIDEILQTIRAATETTGDPVPEATPPVPADDPSVKVIYVALTAQSMKDEREKLLKELKGRQHFKNLRIKILPDEEIDVRELQLKSCQAFETLVNDYIGRSHLSVHITNEVYGAIPEGSNTKKSLVEIQYEAAVQHSKRRPDGDFHCVVRKAATTTPAEPEQVQFFDRMEQDARQQPQVQLFTQRNFQDFVSFVEEKIVSQARKQEVILSVDGSDTKYVYFIYDKSDRNNTRTKELAMRFSSHYEMLYPVFPESVDQAKVVSHHEDQLMQCDGVIIYHGSSTDSWCHSILGEVRKAKLQRQEMKKHRKDIIAKTVLIDDPRESKLMHTFNSKEFLVLQAWEDSWLTQMESYFKNRV
jgi:hypothetical protein